MSGRPARVYRKRRARHRHEQRESRKARPTCRQSTHWRTLSTPADTAFPLAESEGLKPPPRRRHSLSSLWEQRMPR